ncbi:unnamed protein product [Schistosoma turkestanicum]|nr:unnamed protein product [Schistosoma turkestanicum]
MEVSNVNKKVIFLPVDASDHSIRAFQWYLDNLRGKNDELHFVHVIKPIFTTPTIELAMTSSLINNIMQSTRENIENGKKLLQSYLIKAKNCGIPCQAFVHVDAKPGKSLIKLAEEHKVDIIIMGSRGSGVICRTLLGSITNYLMHHAKNPLVIIPPPVK